MNYLPQILRVKLSERTSDHPLSIIYQRKTFFGSEVVQNLHLKSSLIMFINVSHKRVSRPVQSALEFEEFCTANLGQI